MNTQMPQSFYAARVAEPLRTLANQAGAALKILSETPPPQFAVQNLARGRAPILPKLKSIVPTSLAWGDRAAGSRINVTGQDLQDMEEFALIPAENLADDQFIAKAGLLSAPTKSGFVAAINLQDAPAGTYHAWVRNRYGQEDLLLNQLTIHPAQPPSITTQPSSLVVNTRSNARFTVVASGTGPLNYQWRINANPIPGATSANYDIPSVSAADAGSYDVVVSNAADSVTSAPAQLIVSSPPSITTQPVTATVTPGGGARFTIVASGTGPLNYQWRINAMPIPGATSANYDIPSVSAAHVGSYDVVVSNAAGSVTSAPAQLTVIRRPAIVRKPADLSVLAGSNAVFAVEATGTDPLTYQWQKDHRDLQGECGHILVLEKVTQSEAGKYTVVVRNSVGDDRCEAELWVTKSK